MRHRKLWHVIRNEQIKIILKNGNFNLHFQGNRANTRKGTKWGGTGLEEKTFSSTCSILVEVLMKHPEWACQYIVIKEGQNFYTDPYSLILQVNIFLYYVIGTMLRYVEIMINDTQVFSISDSMFRYIHLNRQLYLSVLGQDVEIQSSMKTGLGKLNLGASRDML